jgi:hypothetical protein
MNDEILAYGTYLCLRRAPADLAVDALAHAHGFRNEYDGGSGEAAGTIAFLRRADAAVPRDLADEGLVHADAVVHLGSPHAGRIAALAAAIEGLLAGTDAPRARRLDGVVRPKQYTSASIHDFAYARQVTPQPAAAMPHAWLVPMRKTDAWWQKDWMERHTYFLPRYSDDGRRQSEGHVLAAAAGVACLVRRTYRAADLPAPSGGYDFVNYFECADADVPTFHAVCDRLRDVTLNPEWRFVQEGPTWHGRRVRTWAEMWTAASPR